MEKKVLQSIHNDMYTFYASLQCIYTIFLNVLFIFSACTSASLEPSYVLRAIGAEEDLAHSSIRYIYYCVGLVENPAWCNG